MQLAISLIPAGIRQFMDPGSGLSRLKMCNAILLVLLSNSSCDLHFLRIVIGFWDITRESQGYAAQII